MSKFRPRVSFVCPTYNRASMLEACVKPVADRTDRDWEFIIADDGSTDNTAEVSQSLVKQFGIDRVVLSPASQNVGAQVSRNRGASMARGDFVVYVDSDDVPDPIGYAALEDFLGRNEELDFAYGKVLVVDQRLRSTGRMVGSAFKCSPKEVAGYHWHTMGAMYRKSFLERLGPWNELLKGSQDWEFQARAKMVGEGAFLDVVVGYWRQHDGQRIGTQKFSSEYLHSAMLAFRSIAEKAKDMGVYDRDLAKRFAWKWIHVGFNFGANGHAVQRVECLDEAIGSCDGSTGLRLALKVLRRAPSILDYLILRCLVSCARNATFRCLRNMVIDWRK